MNSTSPVNVDRVLTFLYKRGVPYFVHFTSVDNLKSILASGIIPRNKLDTDNIPYQSNDEYRLDGNTHVNLSITHPNCKFLYRARERHPDTEYAVITINPRILENYSGIDGRETFSFSSTNAASNKARKCNVEELFAGERPDFFKQEWPTDEQSEVLIPGIVPPQFFLSIEFPEKFGSSIEQCNLLASIDSIISSNHLSCKVNLNDNVFSDERFRQGRASQFERYFQSWRASKADYTAMEQAIGAFERVKSFDSTAVSLDSLSSARAMLEKKQCYPMWKARLPKSNGLENRSASELSVLSVVEKIVNRGRITLVSEIVEQQLYELTTNRDELDQLISFTHQIQCTMVELAKRQIISFHTQISLDNHRSQIEIDPQFLLPAADIALSDLKKLFDSISTLYSCENPIKDVQIVPPNSNAANSVVIALLFIDEFLDLDKELDHNTVQISSIKFPRKEPTNFDFVKVDAVTDVNPNSEAIRFVLNYIFRFNSFREGQIDGILRGLQRKDSIVLLPTGSGKSIIFQLLALLTPGTAFVISPLISLIDDQIDNLQKAGIDRIIGVSSKSKDMPKIEFNIATGQFLICYSAPERFQNQMFLKAVKNYSSFNLVSVIAIDEAHCVSEWGHDFRASYLSLARTCRSVCCTGEAIPPLLALTGTASLSVLHDMKHDLEITSNDAIIVPRDFNRKEIKFRVIETSSKEKLRTLASLIDEAIPQDIGASREQLYTPTGDITTNAGIVFCQHVNGSYGLMASGKQLYYGHYGVYDYLHKEFSDWCSFYSGEKPRRFSCRDWSSEKQRQAARFKNNKSSIMVATKAFGMGIDKPNVRWIVHFGMSSSLESYYQEVGRAARDGKEAYAYLILSNDYPNLNHQILDATGTSAEEASHLDDSKEKFEGDDISRLIGLHSKTYIGPNQEFELSKQLLEECQRENYSNGHWEVNFSNETKSKKERAIYRFCLLGIFDSYMVDYSNTPHFIITPCRKRGEELRLHIKEQYLRHISLYQTDEKYLSAAKTAFEGAVADASNDRDYIYKALYHLLSTFTYGVVEKSRRRAISTFLEAAEKAAHAANKAEADESFRTDLLAYLSIGDMQHKGLNNILNDATNLDLIADIIYQAGINGETPSDLRLQCQRFLEDYPEHYGANFILAITSFADNKLKRFSQELKTSIHFGINQYSLSIDQCLETMIGFLNSQAGSAVSAEELTTILPILANAYQTNQNSILFQLHSEQAIMLQKLNTIYRISRIAKRG